MNTTLEFNYENTSIHFIKTDEAVMVNATEMAKAFGKRIDFFLKTDHAKAFIEILKLPPNGGSFEPLADNEIIQSRSGSRTYFHRILALKFAAWLSPAFELWVYATIDQILFGHYREMEESIKESARRKAEMDRIEQKLAEDPEYQQLERLRLEEKQAAYRRGKENRQQMTMFKEMYESNE